MALRWAIACRLALAPGGWQISAVAGCDVRSVTVRPILADEVGRFNALAGRSSLARASADRAGAALRRGPGRRVGRAGRVRVRCAVVRSPGPLPRVEPRGAVRAAAPCRAQPAVLRAARRGAAQPRLRGARPGAAPPGGRLPRGLRAVSYTHLRAHETDSY